MPLKGIRPWHYGCTLVSLIGEILYGLPRPDFTGFPILFPYALLIYEVNGSNALATIQILPNRDSRLITSFFRLKLLITALRQEAQPIIDALDLRQDRTSRKIPIFSSGDTLLVVSGMGKLRAAVATTHGLHVAGNPANCTLINVGMCGSAVQRIELGEAVLVNKIWDHGSGREYFPDMLLNFPLQEASLGTFEKPVTVDYRPELSCEIVDMEASGIFQAGQLFVSPHRMLYIKVATDYLDYSEQDFPNMVQYFEQSVAQWLPLLRSFKHLEEGDPILSPVQESFLKSTVDQLRLSQTQFHQLRDAAIRFLVRGGEDLRILDTFVSSRPEHKSVRNRIFDAMIQELDG